MVALGTLPQHALLGKRSGVRVRSGRTYNETALLRRTLQILTRVAEVPGHVTHADTQQPR